MHRVYMTKEAAEYCGGLPVNFLLHQAKIGKIAYVQCSPKRILFKQTDLDAWMASWQAHDATETMTAA